MIFTFEVFEYMKLDGEAFMKKDIAIITWHNHRNFGGNLQAYALNYTLQKLGYSSVFINYTKKITILRFIKKKLQLVVSYVYDMIPAQQSPKYSYRFARFQHKYLPQTKPIYSMQKLNSLSGKYKVFICGSDQIWAPNVFNPVYFLSFVSCKCKKIAYAPSIGLSEIPVRLLEQYKMLISNIGYVSVREYQSAQMIKELFSIHAEVVLDPTFLVSREEWLKIAKTSLNSGEYIFCYFLGDSIQHTHIAKKLSKKLGCKIIGISKSSFNQIQFDINDEFAGPQEFLSYIANAKLVLTDSFHGMALSIIMNVNFYVFERFKDDDPINQNLRIYNIINTFGLTDRLIDDIPCSIKTINYDSVNKQLNSEKERSNEFLLSSISSIMMMRAK